MNLEAIGAKVIIEPERIMETDSGIERADQGHSTPVKGKVVSAGAESRFKVGDVLLFRRYSVDELKMPAKDGTETVVFVAEDGDIVARVV